MIHEDITISGSFLVSGSFILPRIPSNSLATATTGSMFYDTVNDVVKIYTGTGSTSDGYVTVGAQSEPAAAGGGGGSSDIEYVVIAGGGGGGTNSNSGGGGAGGYLSSSIASVSSGSTFTVTVGAGGGVGSNSNGSNGSNSSIAGSSISTITATGGGGGSKQGGTAGSGGSGGGGAYDTTGGDGTSGQGFDGGDGVASGDYPGGGGGGAGEAGNTDGSGTGGDGKASSITGTSVTRAGGGSGGVSGGGTVRAAGDGGGGTGAEGNNTAPVAATVNTGGGGAGGAADTAGLPGAAGTVIFAYPTASISATGGVRTFFNNRVAHTFNSSGTFTVSGTKTYTHNTLDVFGDGSCKALYKFEGNANDESGNYNGTASSITYAQSYINNGAVFTGNTNALAGSKVTVSNSVYGANKSIFSISGWVNYGTTNSELPIFGNGGTVGGTTGYAVYTYLGEIIVTFRTDPNQNFYSTGQYLDDNQWHHIALTFNNGTYALYIDGSVSLSGTTTNYTSNPTPTYDTHFGNRFSRNETGVLNGSMDQIRIFDKALSASEVATLYTE